MKTVAEFEAMKGRLATAAALVYRVDFDGFEAICVRAASPQALAAGEFTPVAQAQAKRWLALARAARALKEAAVLEPDVMQRAEALFAKLLGSEGGAR